MQNSLGGFKCQQQFTGPIKILFSGPHKINLVPTKKRKKEREKEKSHTSKRAQFFALILETTEVYVGFTKMEILCY